MIINIILLLDEQGVILSQGVQSNVQSFQYIINDLSSDNFFQCRTLRAVFKRFAPFSVKKLNYMYPYPTTIFRSFYLSKGIVFRINQYMIKTINLFFVKKGDILSLGGLSI